MDYEAGAGCEAPPGSGEIKEPEGNFSVLHSLRVGREILVMNFGVFPPRAASSQPWHFLCSHEHQPEFSLLLSSGWRAAEVPNLHSQEKDGSFSVSQHVPSPCSSNTSGVPRRRSIAGAGSAEAWEKTLTLASCCLLFLSQVPTEQQQSLPGVPWSSWDTWKKIQAECWKEEA